MKPNIRTILSVVLAIICLFSTAKVLIQWLDQGEGDNSYENAAALAQSAQTATAPTAVPTTEATKPPATAPPETEPPATEPLETEPPEPIWVPAPMDEEDPILTDLASTDLNALREVNPDVVGWIYIPLTKVNYPLMQGEDNTFYLEHTWDKKPNSYGSIFLECQNSPDLTDFNTIIYGHNMANGTMFGILSNFAYQWFYNWNHYVYIVTDAGTFRYEIFSSYSAPVDSPTYGLSFNHMNTREEFITMALENSQIQTGVTPAATDRIVTLSTCTGLGYENRRVVHAYLKMIPVETQ